MSVINKLKKLALIPLVFVNLMGFTDLDEKTDKVKFIVSKILQTDEKNRFIQAEISNYSKGYYKEGKKMPKLIESRVLGKVILKKPNNILFHVIESDNPMARGATLLYKGGKEVRVRASGVFGFVPINFDIDNPMFRNSRNHKFTFDGLAAVRNDKANVSLISTSEIHNKKVYVLKVVSPTKADPEITHEIYKVDAKTFVVMSIRMYVNNDMVSEYTIKNINNNIIKNDNLFKI